MLVLFMRDYSPAGLASLRLGAVPGGARDLFRLRCAHALGRGALRQADAVGLLKVEDSVHELESVGSGVLVHDLPVRHEQKRGDGFDTPLLANVPAVVVGVDGDAGPGRVKKKIRRKSDCPYESKKKLEIRLLKRNSPSREPDCVPGE